MYSFISHWAVSWLSSSCRPIDQAVQGPCGHVLKVGETDTGRDALHESEQGEQSTGGWAQLCLGAARNAALRGYGAGAAYRMRRCSQGNFGHCQQREQKSTSSEVWAGTVCWHCETGPRWCEVARWCEVGD